MSIKDIYVNIPINETINITRTQLLKNNDIQTTNQMITLLEIILKQNYFSFQGQIYHLNKGMAMDPQSLEPWPKYFYNTSKITT